MQQEVSSRSSQKSFGILMTHEQSETGHLFRPASAAFGIAFLIVAIACGWLGIQWQQTAASVVSVQKSLRTLEAELDDVEH